MVFGTPKSRIHGMKQYIWTKDFLDNRQWLSQQKPSVGFSELCLNQRSDTETMSANSKLNEFDGVSLAGAKISLQYMFIVSVLYTSEAEELLKLNYFLLESGVLQCHDKGHGQVIMEKTASGYPSAISETCQFFIFLQKNKL